MRRYNLIILFTLLFQVYVHSEDRVHNHPAAGLVLGVSGPGFLEVIDGQQVMHLKGNAYQLGYQHGELLREQIAGNIIRFIDKLSSKNAPQVVKDFLANLPQLMAYIPQFLVQEMHGIADGAGIPYEKIVLLNLFPEMFHCTGMTVADKATSDGSLYHVRVLDYATGMTIQNTAVLAVVEPSDGNAFVNVTYAGFVGCVTGMNEKKIAIGEIGGKGYGSWRGVPMAFLLREILETQSSLEGIKTYLSDRARTCEYYYVFSDGKTNESLGVYATADTIDFINPGEDYKFQSSSHLHQQPKDSIAITRWDNYNVLIDRLMTHYGKIGVVELQEIIKRPVAHASNLHVAIFHPGTAEIWISHAGPHNEPACDQKYHHFNLEELLSRPLCLY